MQLLLLFVCVAFSFNLQPLSFIDEAILIVEEGDVETVDVTIKNLKALKKHSVNWFDGVIAKLESGREFFLGSNGTAEEVEVLTEAKQGSQGIGWGCVAATATYTLTKDVPKMIDGDQETNAIKTCDRLNTVAFSESKIRTGCFKMFWNDVPDNNNGRYSFATSVDGIKWTRMGACDKFNGVKALLKSGMCVNAPAIAFKYFGFSTACWNSHIREVVWTV